MDKLQVTKIYNYLNKSMSSADPSSPVPPRLPEGQFLCAAVRSLPPAWGLCALATRVLVTWQCRHCLG